jgi:hypothetical protein
MEFVKKNFNPSLYEIDDFFSNRPSIIHPAYFFSIQVLLIIRIKQIIILFKVVNQATKKRYVRVVEECHGPWIQLKDEKGFNYHYFGVISYLRLYM